MTEHEWAGTTVHDEFGVPPDEELAGALDRFAAAFTTLGALLRRPVEQSFLDSVRDTGLLGEWPLRGDEDSERGLTLLSRATAEDVGEIRTDFSRLFIGPGRLLAPPYESVYRSREGLVFEAETLQVRARYKAWGLQAPHLNREPDDHVGLELEFLGTLCLRGLDAIETGDADLLGRVREEISGFLDDHVLRWVPACMDDVAAGARTACYRAVAALVQGALAHAEQAFLGVDRS